LGAGASRPPGSRRLRFALLTALIAVFGLALASPSFGAFLTVVDDAGANDEPGQKDLTLLQVDDSQTGSGVLLVNWNWDITGLTGNNSADGCALFDTDQDGKVNYAICVTAKDTPLTQVSDSPRLYSCGDDKSDRCTSPNPLIADGNGTTLPGDVPQIQSSCTVVNNSPTDPFTTGDSYPNDTQAQCTLDLTEVANARLVNVCSYPSQEPNSDPSDCVITPGSGFLTIVKVADPSDSTNFDFTLDPAARNGDTDFQIQGSGSVSLITVDETKSYSLTELVPANWDLTSASCTINDLAGSSTGTFSDANDEVTGIEITEGLTTTCTFNDSFVTRTTDTSTTPSDTTILLGASVTDGATVTAETGTPTGTVDFYLCGPLGDTATCGSGEGDLVGDDVALVDGHADSPPVSPTEPGRYCFRAVYTSDDPLFEDSEDFDSADECFDVIAPNVSVEKTADSGTISAGDTAAFTIVVTSDGIGTATGVALTDTLPTGVYWS
jgi:uncharacterized repeat protein (TIGR01451 family)